MSPWKFAGICCLSAAAHAAPAHVHGEGKLQIALEGDTLTVILDTPVDNLLGFERQPRTPAETQAVKRMAETLRQPERLFTLPAAAECRPGLPRLESPLFQAASRSQHLDLNAEYRWQCRHVEALRSLDTRLFEQFPGLRALRVEAILPGGQTSGRLNRNAPRFSW